MDQLKQLPTIDTPDLVDDDEVLTFGSHNMHAERFPIGHILESFPWDLMFRTLGYADAYPALLYTDDEADTLYQQISCQLTKRVGDEQLTIGVHLEFHDQTNNDTPIGELEIQLHEHALNTLPTSVQPHWLTLIAEAVVRYVEQHESYGHTVVRLHSEIQTEGDGQLFLRLQIA